MKYTRHKSSSEYKSFDTPLINRFNEYMPARRRAPLVSDHIYHIFNRGVAKLPTFTSPHEYRRALELINYHRFANIPFKYSTYLKLPFGEQAIIDAKLQKDNDLLVKIITFKLMPNHFHFIVKQVKDGGISKYISRFTNSYTKYVNEKNRRVGPLFQGKFKSVLIKTDEQLLHLSRYIHLNLYTDKIAATFKELLTYVYSSLPHYIGTHTYDFVDSEPILSHFKDASAYKQFVLRYAQYQRTLGRIKKLTLEHSAKSVRKHLRGGQA